MLASLKSSCKTKSIFLPLHNFLFNSFCKDSKWKKILSISSLTSCFKAKIATSCSNLPSSRFSIRSNAFALYSFDLFFILLIFCFLIFVLADFICFNFFNKTSFIFLPSMFLEVRNSFMASLKTFFIKLLFTSLSASSLNIPGTSLMSLK